MIGPPIDPPNTSRARLGELSSSPTSENHLSQRYLKQTYRPAALLKKDWQRSSWPVKVNADPTSLLVPLFGTKKSAHRRNALIRVSSGGRNSKFFYRFGSCPPKRCLTSSGTVRFVRRSAIVDIDTIQKNIGWSSTCRPKSFTGNARWRLSRSATL